MGFSDWLAEKLMTPEQRAEIKQTVVTVVFQDLLSPVPEYDGTGYSYLWPFDVAPSVGDRVLVPGSRGPSAAVVVHCGRSPGSLGMTLKSVVRVVDPDEVAGVEDQHVADLCAWLDLARKKAGLPVDGPVSRSLPAGFAPVPPVSGKASAKRARENADGWWWASKRAEELGRDDDEIDEFRDIAGYWYEIADDLDSEG